MNKTQSAIDDLMSPISSEGLAFANELRDHPDFLPLAADLNTEPKYLIETIARARMSAKHSHDSYNVRKIEANKLARGLLDLLQTGTLTDVPGEQLVLHLALNSLVKQSDFHPVVGSLKTKGREAGHRIARQSLYMDAVAYDFQLTKTTYARLCSITDDRINSDTANSDYRKFQSDPKIKELHNLSTSFAEIAILYDEQIFRKNKILSPTLSD
jgi:hypothetical protein